MPRWRGLTIGGSFRLELKFWGVRGSIAVPQSEVLRFGGNTTCVQVRLPDATNLIIDGGTGLRNLGKELMRELPAPKLPLHIVMTHFHWDHIQGIPFFAPLYVATNTVTFHSSRPCQELREILEGQMAAPYSPIRFEMLCAKRVFVHVPSEGIGYGDLRIYPFPLNHPQGATGYRFESEGAVVVHASDFEHGNAEMDSVLRQYARDADILVYDSQYTPQEYEAKKGWGHSTWLEGVRVAREANVKRLILFHHDPDHSDRFLESLVDEARSHFPNTDAAREGWAIRV
jgi:phosphoribosyl 1,2-cyclic phosphodiesterase